MKQPASNNSDNDAISEDVSLNELFAAFGNALVGDDSSYDYDDDSLFDENLLSALSNFKKASHLNNLQKYSLFLGSPDVSRSPAHSVLAQKKEDWDMVAQLSGYGQEDFADAGAALPLTRQEIEFFLRNHRSVKHHIIRDFFAIQSNLPSPLAELYGLYRYRARIDAEAALFIAQSTLSTRLASSMAKILSLGAFANGIEYVKHLTVTYSVPCAFDTSLEITAANMEAERRLSLSPDHPAHLLRLSSNDIAVLASVIAENNALSCDEFLEKANFLAEAYQDVYRLPTRQRLHTALKEGDVPWHTFWTKSLIEAYKTLLPIWGDDI
ncbi:MAG: hypothetical protein FWF23_01280 [Alphaproteobacteria bacterium]|nr:hypothetical protein [Alphaproteobacteria bacterium]MCL2505978.1 hypothetical protein [Alphaproteobacteria bacterium]